MRLATHCRDSWVRPLRAPARMRPQLGDRFLMDYFPRPLEGGGGAASPVCPEAPARTGPKRPARGPAAQPPTKGGQQHAGRALLGALGPVLRPVPEPGLGHQPLQPGGPRRPHRLLDGPQLPQGPAPRCAGARGTRPRSQARGGGRVVLLVGAGTPSLLGPPGPRPSGGPPMYSPA